ncbi:unnamed protein product [Phyllotreta striolata]|uniref:Protein-lysine N-methyltransferase PHYEVI_LOCUS10706 n=1 Tax=Phyllotreta striolata TaxID=444603 RepID=A0A9N9XSK3_PHYSR|nr:unnamed protein product [Phyllotreta striolata]
MEELSPCELGTQQYWDSRYSEEIDNFKSHGDPGEIWFGEDTVDRIIRWMNNCALITKESKLIDVGCGNGMLLIELANEGYTNLTGIDYSDSAIKLAKEIAEKQALSITYFACDILKGIRDCYEIIHDKGTYDAVSLSENPKENRLKYIDSVHESLADKGLLIVTSCNWTQNELNKHFEDKFNLYNVIPTPQFKFGGKVGNVVTSCVYQKK